MSGAFVLTAVLLIVLVALTLGLWQAEMRSSGTSTTHAPVYALWGGLLISVLMSGAVLQALIHRVRAQEQTQKQLEAIESLHAISTAIGAQIKEGTALDALATAAYRLLQMDRAVIAMLHQPAHSLQVVASAGTMPPDFPAIFNLKDLPASSYCIEKNVSVFEGDTLRPGRSYGSEAVKAFDAGSLILIPLRLDYKAIGLLTLSSSRPRDFSALDRRVGELLGAQASVVLSNQQLYQQMRTALESSERLLHQREALAVENTRLLEQTRNDAGTKTVLLRELNHRVKNNLAGIVALLELRPPSMPPDVKQWLDRATERIRAMAGAHQLFTAGGARAAVNSLIAQAIAAATVNKPPNVHVKIDVDAAGRTVGADQAVALAMVLNELCYNALVHGLRDGGTLTIRAREGTHANASSGSTDKIVIEVADDGAGGFVPAIDDQSSLAGTDTSSAPGSGEGLDLVEGLVRRELKGAFSIRSAAGVGTTATVEFQLSRENIRQSLEA